MILFSIKLAKKLLLLLFKQTLFEKGGGPEWVRLENNLINQPVYEHCKPMGSFIKHSFLTLNIPMSYAIRL